MIIFGKKHYRQKTMEELVVMAQHDDLDAVEELVKRNQENIYASFYYLSSNCEDFKPWLNQIVTRLFYDYIRSKNRKLKTVPIDKKEDDEQDRFNVAEVPCGKCSPEESSLNSELHCIIERSIHKLPESFRLAIVLREFQGLSYEEIAEITKTNVGTVKSRIARARNKLQEELKEYIA